MEIDLDFGPENPDDRAPTRILRVGKLSPSTEIKLPVGIMRPGDDHRYREVTIDEMCGRDEENLANAKVRRNASLACTTLLRRCIQSIPGLVPDKTNPLGMIEMNPVREWMTQIDRDFLLVSILVLSGQGKSVVRGHCEPCDEGIEEDVHFSDLDMYDWPDDAPLSISGMLPKGYRDRKGGVHREFTLAFPSGKVQENVIAQARGNSGMASTLLMSSCLMRLGDHDHVDSDMATSLRALDRGHIGRLYSDEFPGLSLTKTISCDRCGREYEEGIDLSGFFVEALAPKKKKR